MSQTLVVNDVIKAQIWCQDNEQSSVNTFHYKVTAISGPAPSLEDFLGQWSGVVMGPMANCIADLAEVVGCRAQIVLPLPLFTAIQTTGAPTPGLGGAVGSARQVAGLISWRTALAGPGGRGRTYLPFVSASDMTGIGLPTPEYVARATAFGTAIGNFKSVTSGGGTATVAVCIRNLKKGTQTVITEGVIQTKWATQKRRGSYGRPNSNPFTGA
jgi:hypothetical protein